MKKKQKFDKVKISTFTRTEKRKKKKRRGTFKFHLAVSQFPYNGCL